MLDNELHNLRIRKRLPASDMVETVRELYPRYDKTLQSKCENDQYGIDLKPEAMKHLFERFALEELERPKRHRSGGHRLTCRIMARLETEQYNELQQRIRAEGYSTMQDWLSAMVRRYLESEGSADV